MIEAASAEAVARAGAMIRGGELVSFPTETVYGLGADACSDAAVARVFEAKDRPSFNPLIVHVASLADAARLGRIDGDASALARAFWPGPLSLVVPRLPGCPVSPLASAGLDTVALRVPAHATAQALLAAAGRPVAAPSANPSGGVSPTRARHVADSLAGGILVIDGGPCAVGLESTVVACAGGRPAVLRPGGVSTEEVERVVGPVDAAGAAADGPAPSPGMQRRHYAPDTPLRLDAGSVRPGEALLSFGRHRIPGAAAERNLSPSGDTLEAAANLFAMLRELDGLRPRGIAAMPVPGAGLGRAINDRLRRAAAPGGVARRGAVR